MTQSYSGIGINGEEQNLESQEQVRGNTIDNALSDYSLPFKSCDYNKEVSSDLQEPDVNSSKSDQQNNCINLDSFPNNSLAEYFSSFDPSSEESNSTFNFTAFDMTEKNAMYTADDKEVSGDKEDPDYNSSKSDQEDICINLDSFQNNSLAEFFSSFDPLSEENNSNSNSISFDMTEENALSYIAGYMCHILAKHHNCETCKLKVTDPHYTVTSDNIYLSLKDSENRRYLKYPTKLIIEVIKEYELIFKAHIKDFIFKSNVATKMLDIVRNKCERKKERFV